MYSVGTVLVIRPEQIDAFRQEEWKSFLRQIRRDVQTELARRGDPRATGPFADAVDETIGLARAHGFVQRPHLARFVRLVLVHQPDVATLNILDDESIGDDARLAHLERALEP